MRFTIKIKLNRCLILVTCTINTTQIIAPDFTEQKYTSAYWSWKCHLEAINKRNMKGGFLGQTPLTEGKNHQHKYPGKSGNSSGNLVCNVSKTQIFVIMPVTSKK